MGQLSEVMRQAPPAVVDGGRRFYQPELDGLRFYAFLGVFVFHVLPSQGAYYRSLHLPMPVLWAGVVKAGGAGVDLFFALSAFLITSLLLRERQETGGISLRRFYIRRILRIWPLYFLMIVLGAVLSHTMVTQRLPWYYIAGYLLFVGNWVQAVFGSPRSICAPLWTVSIEEQFYLIWPVLVKALERRGMVIAGVFVFVAATVSQMGIVLAGGSEGYIYYGSLSRCDSLVVGIMLALFAERLPKLTSGPRVLLIFGGMSGSIVASAWFLDQQGSIDMRAVFGRLIISIASGAILYGSLYSRNSLVKGRWVVRLGKISYGLYVLHFTGILIMQILLHPASAGGMLAAKGMGLIMTIILALGSYRWVESPFLRLKDRFATVLSRPV